MEIAHRASRHASAYAPLRKTLVKRGLHVKAKLTYIDSFATGLLHTHTHAGAWEALSGPQAAKLDSLQLHFYRQAAGQIWSPKKNTATNTEIFEKSKRVPVSVQVSIDRIRFVWRVANHSSNVFRALIDCTLGVDGTWLAAVGEHLIWARKMLHRRSDLPKAASLKEWVRHAQTTSALSWKLMLKHISKGYLTSGATRGPFREGKNRTN